MEKPNVRVLFVDDDEDDYVLFSQYLGDIQDRKFNIKWAPTFDKGQDEIRNNEYDILFFDYLLGVRNGIDLLMFTKEIGVNTPVILLTGKGDLKTDMNAMRLGAADYLVKSELDTEKLDRSIRYTLERSQALRALQESEEKYHNVFERSHDMIYITDSDGKFIDVNESASRILGYSREELLQMRARDLFNSEEERRSFLRAISMTGEINNYELTLRHKSGEKRYCLISVSVQKEMNQGEEQEHFIGIIHDFTNRRKAEMDLLIAEKLAVTGRVVRTLAHEIRNPLTNINLSLDHIKSEVSNEDLDQFFEIIRRNNKRINDIITDLLSTSGPASVEKSVCTLNNIAEEVIQMSMDRIVLKDIKLEKDLSSETCEVSVDKSKVKLALLNIVINSIEAMEEGKGVLNIQTETNEDRCIVRIRDNGSGISNEDIGKLFEPYFTNKTSGVGLGLVATHNILKSHQATVDVESELGKGTCFTISFEMHKKLETAES